MNMNIKLIYFVALVAVITGGCKKSFLNVNTNPNELPTATPSYVFTNALNTTARNMVAPNELGSYWAGQWTQSNGYILTTSYFSYSYTNTDFNFWDGFYNNLEDYQYVINNADANSQQYLKGPSKVMKALLFQYLVDMYGNVPYTEALKGVSTLAPKFDDQKLVYENLIKLLDSAIVDLKASAFASSFAGSDIVFKGNTTKWIQFANSLKLRILIHQSRIVGRDAYIISEINKIVAEGTGFLNNYDVGVGGSTFFQPTAGKLNPLYDLWGYSETGAKRALNNYPRLTEFLVNTLKYTNDTFRLKRIGYAIGGEGSTPGVSLKPEISSNYVGIPFGSPSGYLPSAASALGPSLIVKGEFNRAYILFTAAEAQFLLAETKERYGGSVNLSGTAQSYYEEGVRQSFRVLGASVSKANDLLASGIADADWVASPDKLKAIATQKWIALINFNGLEAWTEYRRTNLPATPQSVSYIGTDRPLRLYYPNTESGSNSANVAAQGNINIFTTKIFWDVN